MKKLLILTLGIIPCLASAQSLIDDNFPVQDGSIIYTEVIQVDSISANDLYLNAKTWLAEAFKSSNAVIQSDDKEEKVLIIKSYIIKGHNAALSNPKNWFTIKLEFKDGRYRYSLYDIRYEFDIYASGASLHTDVKLEEWLQPSDKEMSAKRREKVNAALGNYCHELNQQFISVINTMKHTLSQVKDDEW